MAFNVRKFMPSLPSIPHVGPLLTGNSNALPPGVSAEEHAVSQRELSTLVDKLVGNLDSPNDEAVAKRETDRLIAALIESDDSRTRLIDQYLRARHGNPREAAQMITQALKWRNQVNILDYMHRATEFLSHPNARFPMTVISSAEICRQPVVYGLIRLLDKRKIERDPFNNAVISFFESLYFAESYSQDEMIVILDFRGWSLRKHAPYRVVKDGLGMLQNYYPERLERVFLVNYPATLRAAYTAVSPVIDSGARSKIIWVPADPCETMEKHGVLRKSIPSFMGGELQARVPEYWPDVRAEWENPALVTQTSW